MNFVLKQSTLKIRDQISQKKVISERNERKQVLNSESTTLSNTVNKFLLKRSTVKFCDEICSKHILFLTEVKKQLSNSESAPLNDRPYVPSFI